MIATQDLDCRPRLPISAKAPDGREAQSSVPSVFSVVNPELEAHLQPELQRPWSMRIDGMQERRACQAIRPTLGLEPSGI